jgi:hypothetical protein
MPPFAARKVGGAYPHRRALCVMPGLLARRASDASVLLPWVGTMATAAPTSSTTGDDTARRDALMKVRRRLRQRQGRRGSSPHRRQRRDQQLRVLRGEVRVRNLGFAHH